MNQKPTKWECRAAEFKSIVPIRKSIIILCLQIFCISAFNQTLSPVQQLRGTVLDQVLQSPLPGVTVHLMGQDLSVVTDEKGKFRFSAVPIGQHQLVFSSVGYKEVILDPLNIISGKETVLTISMETSVNTGESVLIKTNSRKNRPLNEMSTVSARAFTVEETQKYAAAVNDPLRMAAAFPGVLMADDGNNNIIIRGNSPTGLLWRMEGVDIPNPNHFSSTGSSGGGISILSTQLLSNSDFITSAFAAEYGNALSGVFDLRLRRGNNEKREFTLQAGLLGLNAAAEGPLAPSLGGSYLVNYRYSTLELLNRIGVPLEGGSTNFQDLAYHVYLPTKKLGNFSWFGFGGLSSQNEKAEMDSLKWSGRYDRYTSRFVSNTGATGMTHQVFLSSKTTLRSALSFSMNRIFDDFRYVEDDYSLSEEYSDHFKTKKWNLTTTLNHKFSPKSIIRAGANASWISLDYFQRSKEHEQAPIRDVINSRDHTQTVQAHAQWQYKPVQAFTIQAGLHFMQLLLNNSKALEPRVSMKWQAGNRNSLAIGFGLHSQLQGLGVYFARRERAGDEIDLPNKNLDFTRARHLVLSYQHSFQKYLSLKAELYHQGLYRVPVSTYDTSSFSVLNIQSEYVTDALVNRGKGENYGLELSLEKYLNRNFYYTFSTSLYQSKYQAADGVNRNTRFNGNYLLNLVAGREFPSSGQLRTFGVHIKAIYAGGLRTTPINLERSIAEERVIYEQHLAYSNKNPDYFRSDLRLSIKWNRKRLTSTLSLDIQNVTNRLNVYGERFDSDKKELAMIYQNGIIPVLNYKVEF